MSKPKKVAASPASTRSKPSARTTARRTRRRIAEQGSPFFIDMTVVADGESKDERSALTWDLLQVFGRDQKGKPIEMVKAVRFTCEAGQEAVFEVERYAKDSIGRYPATEILKYPIRSVTIESLRGGCYLHESDIWSTAVPAKVGHYWFRKIGCSKSRLVNVWNSPESPEIFFTSEDGGASVLDKELYAGGEWCGPVPIEDPPA